MSAPVDERPIDHDSATPVVVGGLGELRFLTHKRNDRFISEVLQRGEHWEPFESLVFRYLCRPGALVCDVGANVGWYTIMAAQIGAKVIAAEPDPENFALLEANVALNKCENVELLCAALSDHTGQALLDKSTDNQGDHRILRGQTKSRGKTVVVATRRLDDLLENTRVDVLKIDTQGSEAAVLRGAQRLLSQGVRAILIEFWPHGLSACGSSNQELLSLLDKTGLAILEIDSANWRLLRTDVAELSERTTSGVYSVDGGGHLDLVLVDEVALAAVAHLLCDRPVGQPLIETLEPAPRARVELTVSCIDCDVIPKVPNAGALERRGDVPVQVMHNGIVVLAGGYYGDWMSEIIQRLAGHHEPQEERVFHEIVTRVAESRTGQPVMVELGAFWSYYSLWFLKSVNNSRAVLVEPDPVHLSIARQNLYLNNAEALVLQGAIGHPQEENSFVCESGQVVQPEWLTLGQVLDRGSIARADIVLSDIQGAEIALLEEALPYLSDRVRFLVLSTHDISIAGVPDVHERCLYLLRQSGAHIIAEHHIVESFSGDGLIAVSFEPDDRDMQVEISHARVAESLFPCSNAALADAKRHAANLEHALGVSTAYVESLRDYVSHLEQALAKD